MPKTLILFYFLLYSFLISYSQEKLHKPIDIPIYLSGSFGELRSNHFHAGMDIKTQGEEGLKVYSIDDGYVYRIKISRKGYGKALYIKHPSGIISVYAHLKTFNDQINNYIRKKQYKKKSFEIEVFPYKVELPVKKGEVIAYSGNTGGSSGPHLHFEIRNFKEHPLNPAKFGITIEDTIKPILRSLFAYSLDSLSHINQVQGRVPLFYHKKNDSTYTTDPIVAYGKIGFGVDVYDRQNNSYSRNGVYKVNLKVNGAKVYEHVMDELNFYTSHYINTFIDYPYYKKKYKRIQKLFVEPYNKLEIYTHLVNEGILKVKNNKTYYITIKIADFNNNQINIEIPVRGLETQIKEKNRKEKSPYLVKAGKNNIFDFKKLKIIIPKDAPYYDFYLKYKPFKYGFSLGNYEVPLHKSMQIKYNIKGVSPRWKKKIYLARRGRGKKLYYTPSKVKNDSLISYTKYFGDYQLAFDSVPPKIYPSNFRPKKNLTNYKRLKFDVWEKETGIKSFNGYIDGEWILLEYEHKDHSLTYHFSDKKLKGYKHTLKVIVTDFLGNKGVYKTYFYRKDK